MKNIVKYILVIFLVLACANICDVYGQGEENKRVIIHLENGSEFEANLIDWNQEAGTITVEGFGNELKFQISEVKKIIHLGVDTSPAYTFKETGFYYHARVNYITGNPGMREYQEPGIGISVSAGKRFNRFASVGLGLGYDEYVVGTPENILSTFAEFSGYLIPHNQSISYSLAAGYGFAFKNEDSNLISAKGGWMFYPAVGLRLGKKRMKWTFDIGYKFQEANWIYQNWNGTSDQDILYRRLTLRSGVMF